MSTSGIGLRAAGQTEAAEQVVFKIVAVMVQPGGQTKRVKLFEQVVKIPDRKGINAERFPARMFSRFCKRLKKYLPYLPISMGSLTGFQAKGPISSLKIDAVQARSIVHSIESCIEDAKAARRARCKHPADRVYIRTNSYFEEGRMRGPAEWKEKVCRACGAVIATSSQRIEEVWSDVPRDEHRPDE